MFQSRVSKRRFAALVGLLAAAALVLSSCASKRDDSGAGSGKSGGTLVFGAAGAPKNFDPPFNDEGETDRITRQIFDTLVEYKEGTTDLKPGLAEKWTPSADGKDWTFDLRKNVKFTDGTAMDAKAVCYNFDRWFNMPGAAAQSQMIYYGDVFEGFKNNKGDATGKPLYKSCDAKNANTAVLHLNRNKGAFPAAFGLTPFAIQSPTALKKYNADSVKQNGDSFVYSDYANNHPTGTGAFKFQAYDKAAQTVTLVRNDNYWGPKAKLDKIIFKIIPDENARKQALKSGQIDGYDLPSPTDWKSLKDDDKQLLIRKPVNLLYLGINEKNTPALKDLRVRQAIAYALNRKQLVQTKFPEGAVVAQEFQPDSIAGFAKDVQHYDYNVNKAKQLLKAANASNLTLKFYYPTEVTRPYMPNPQEIAGAIQNDLNAAGIKTKLVPEPWNGGYKDDVQKFGKQDLHLLGWNADYNDAGNFLGTFFGRAKAEFGFNNPALFNELAKADATVDPAAKNAAYVKANQDIMAKYLPAIPLLHSPPAIVVDKNVTGLQPSPLNNEHFAAVSKG